MNIIEKTFNRPLRGADLLYMIAAVIIWELLWHLLFKRILCKFKQSSSFARELLDMGGLVILGIAIFLCFIVILLIASIQIIIFEGWKLIFPISFFWSAVGIGAFFFIRAMIRKR